MGNSQYLRERAFGGRAFSPASLNSLNWGGAGYLVWGGTYLVWGV